MQDLSGSLASTARAIAERLARRGARAWIVGGTVRDLALGREVKDVDMASPATPAIVEATFLRTIPLGRNFGTVVIHLDGHDIEHTTFRSEDGHTDARHPEVVTFGATPEVDAARRDFRCNALYLDPLTDEVLDPTGGLDDLRAGRIACVGDAALRFGEDGLRLVRLARFAGQLGLVPTPETLRGAAASLDALRGVSRERIRLELESLMRRGGAAAAITLLSDLGILARVLPEACDPDLFEARRRLFGHVPAQPGLELGLALLLDPHPIRSVLESQPVAPGPGERSRAGLESLRPPNAVREHVLEAWRLADELESVRSPTRATRVRWMRRPAFQTATLLASARARAAGLDAHSLERLQRERADLGEHGLAPVPWLTAEDLRARGLAPGPVYGEILRAAETLQLDLELTTRAEAVAWLDRRVQEGGNTRLNA